MPLSLQVEMRNQKAVYWENPQGLDHYGQASAYSLPVELDVRWVEKQEEFVDIIGQKQLSQAIVYPGQTSKPYSFFYLGLESDLPSDHDDPLVLKDSGDYQLFQVMQFQDTPDIKNTEVFYTAWLV